MNTTVIGQTFSMKGQLWSSSLTNNDIPDGQSSFESTLGYIPTFSLSKNLTNKQLFDMEWSYRLERVYAGNALLNDKKKHHRYWVRYSSEKLEARLGLQKIIFGPSMVLRSLSWFDTIDVKDPTGQTDGVEAFRLRWFPSNTLTVWSWAILNDQDTLSYGGRTELSTNKGEWGFTFHHDPSKSLQTIGQMEIPIFSPQNRLAIDYRYDGYIGFWNESTRIQFDDLEIGMITIGADYTLPVANGILVMTESMHITSKTNDSTSTQLYTAFMASLPVGMIHQFMFISQIDWEENLNYHYLRWSATYDRYSLNLIVSTSPKRADYNLPEQSLSRSLVGFGTGLQIMFIYNH